MISNYHKPKAPPSCRVFTPSNLAKAMLSYADPKRGESILEPSYGDGVFINEAIELGVDPGDLVAVDLKRRRKRVLPEGVKVSDGQDFLVFASRVGQCFDYVVGNPPYFSLRGGRQGWRSSEGVSALGLTSSAHSNMWQLFLEAALHCVNKGGAIAFLLPAAFESAGYARNVREQVYSKFQSVLLVRSVTPLCPGAKDGVVILLAKGFRKSGRKWKSRILVKDAVEACDVLDQAVVRARSDKSGINSTNKAKSTDCLGDYLKVRIGAVTGDADYFLLKESERKQFSLPVSAFEKCVSKANHLKVDILDRENWKELMFKDERVWLFRPGKGALVNGSVLSYLSLSESDGGCKKDRYKIRRREPWFVTALPETPHAFVSGMKGHLAMTFNAMSSLTFSNTLYGVYFKDNIVEMERYWLAIWLCSSSGVEGLNRITRTYPDGLKKIEPGDLSKIALDETPKISSEAKTVYSNVYAAIANSSLSKAQELADAFLEKCREGHR